MSAEPIIDIRKVSKIFGDGPARIVALQDVNLSIYPQEFISLIGPSGCGKSTLLRLVADLLEPTTGEILVNGKTPREARLNREYGIVFQAPVLYDWRTVLKNVQLPLEIMRYSSMERMQRASAMLALVGLSEFANYYPWQLSGGMQQRVSIARALSFTPKILLMDEPFGALDEMTRERMNLELLRIWQETKTTVIFVTHSIPEAVFLSKRVVVMTPRPAKIEKVVSIDLSYPRDAATREHPHFFTLINEIRAVLREA
jgi:NitT/TauT family transport system ATP-binding protein